VTLRGGRACVMCLRSAFLALTALPAIEAFELTGTDVQLPTDGFLPTITGRQPR
jgi:hypothetical protein